MPNTDGADTDGTLTAGATVPGISVTGISKRFGDARVLHDVTLGVAPGAVVALLGPSGCGKTTLLRIIAGLERPDAGTVQIGGRTVSGPGSFVNPERRRIGMVFQDWALFPHLDVAGNVGYGLDRRDRTTERIEAALDLVGLGGLGRRHPGTLSGGQQQRVALARAIAPRPSVLLLDEPFSNLDTALRVQVRSEIHHLLLELGVTTIFVTHDQEEAFVLGDEVAVMYGGEIVQQASPAALYDAPATPWVAEFVGDANLVEGRADEGVAHTVLGRVPLRADLHGPVLALLRPEELRIGDPARSAADASATVELIEFYGHDTVYLVRADGGPLVRVRAGSAPRFERGDRVVLEYAGDPVVAYPSEVPVDAPARDPLAEPVTAVR
jgi:iron(III) transport system ATP-binding protein